MATCDLPDKFNAEVQCDIMKVYNEQVFVMVDCCTRWSETVIVTGKGKDEVMRALDTWVHRHGAMKKLVFDGESSLRVATQMHDYYHKHTIEACPRAKGQQIAIVDRRIALLRDQLHLCLDQKARGTVMRISSTTERVQLRMQRHAECWWLFTIRVRLR